MTTRRLVLLVAVAMCGFSLRADVASQASQTNQTFRTTADVVFVDVSVRRGGTPVTGLRPEDFDLRDNGVKQRVDGVEAGTVPIDLTLIVDVGRGMGRAVTEPRGETEAANLRDAAATADASALVNEEIRQTSALLRPGDRLRVIVADTYVHEVLPLQSASPVPVVRLRAADGLSSLYDALVTALLQPTVLDRRHVILAGIKDLDRMSVTDAGAVREIASRSDALLHIVLQQARIEDWLAKADLQCESGLCVPTARSWMPQPIRPLQRCTRPGLDGTCMKQLTEEGLLLKGAAEATGGAWHQGELMSEPTVQDTFAKAFEDFRRRYILRYTPQGVKREGWHAIAVTVPSARDATIQSRTGYAIDPPTTDAAGGAAPASAFAPASAPARRSTGQPRTLADFVEAFDTGGAPAVAAGLAALPEPGLVIKAFLDDPSPWPDAPGREAAFALALADTALDLAQGQMSIGRMRGDDNVPKLIERQTILVRHPIEPDELERAWYWALVCLAENKFWRIAAGPVVDRAVARFPDDGRFALAAAIATDQKWRTSGAVVTGSQMTPTQATETHVAEVLAKYAAAAAHAEVRQEADIRRGFFLLRIGRAAEALTALDQAGEPQKDADLAFLRQLFRGDTLFSLGRRTEAVDAYTAAARARPGAQSAIVAAMNALTIDGKLAAAEAMAKQIDAQPATDDPWWSYWFGDGRWFSAALQALKEAKR